MLSVKYMVEYKKSEKGGQFCMTNENALKALKEIKTYCAASLLDELDYVIKVMEKLIKDDVTEPLTTDFTKLKD